MVAVTSARHLLHTGLTGKSGQESGCGATPPGAEGSVLWGVPTLEQACLLPKHSGSCSGSGGTSWGGL